MADLLPTNFPLPSPLAIASYNYSDVAEGTGILLLYGGKLQDSTSARHYLNQTAFRSSLNIATANTALDYTENTDIADAADFTIISGLDLDFDLGEFNYPRDIKGTGYFSIPITTTVGSGGHEFYIIVKLRKWDGTTETEVASAQSGTFSLLYQAYKLLIPMTVPLVHFERGTQLRITLEGYYKGTSPGNPNALRIWHDPKATVANTDIIFSIPTRLTDI